MTLLQELVEHLKESADVTLPALSPNPEEAGAVEAALAEAQLPFVGSCAEALVLTADRRRCAISFATVLALSASAGAT